MSNNGNNSNNSNNLTSVDLGFFTTSARASHPYYVAENPQAARMHQNEGMPLTETRLHEVAQVCNTAIIGEHSLNCYPELASSKLVGALQTFLEVPSNCIATTSGSSQGIALVALGCFAPGKRVAILSPSFSIYEHYARLYGCHVLPISLNDRMQLEKEILFKEEFLSCDVVFLCTPNNPTGGAIDYETLQEFHAKLNPTCLLVVDEAYIEFAPELKSFAGYAAQHKNIVVLRTLSKAWGLAGLRVGALVTHPTVRAVFQALKPPYSSSLLSEAVASHVVRNWQKDMLSRVAFVRSAVQELEKQLEPLQGVEVFPSVGNFVCFRHPRVREFEQLLREQHNILVRVYSSAGPLANICRASIWSSEINTLFIGTARKFFGKEA